MIFTGSCISSGGKAAQGEILHGSRPLCRIDLLDDLAICVRRNCPDDVEALPRLIART